MRKILLIKILITWERRLLYTLRWMWLCLEWKDFFNVAAVDCRLKMMIKLFYTFCGTTIMVIGGFNDLFLNFVNWKYRYPPNYPTYLKKGIELQNGWLTILVILNIWEFGCLQYFHELMQVFSELINLDIEILYFNIWEKYSSLRFQSLGRADYWIRWDGCGCAWIGKIFLMWLP